MPAENLISVKIPAEQLASVKTKVTEIVEILSPHLKSLRADEIRGLFKMSDKSIPFVDKCIEYAKTNPEFLPPYANLEELEVDANAVSKLSEIAKPLMQLLDNLQDTITLSGSEALTTALTYYNSVKQAAKMNVPNAKTIYEDLKKRFEVNSTKNENTPAN